MQGAREKVFIPRRHQPPVIQKQSAMGQIRGLGPVSGSGLALPASLETLADGQVLVNRRHIVVGVCDSLLRPQYAYSPFFDACKSLGTGYLMYEVPVNVQNRRPPIDYFHHMGVPDLIK